MKIHHQRQPTCQPFSPRKEEEHVGRRSCVASRHNGSARDWAYLQTDSFCKLVPSAINCSAIPRTKSTKTDIFCVVALLSERIIKFDPDNSNCQGKLKLLRVIGVSSCRGFQQNDQKHLIMKSGFMLVHVLL